MKKLSKNDIIKRVNEINDKAGLEKEGDKRVYRHRADMPNPDKPHDAEENRLKKRFTFRADPDLLERIAAAAEKEGITRQAWAEKVFLAALENDK